MASFLCWQPDLGYEPQDGRYVQASSASAAAEEYAHHRDSYDADYPDEREVVVRDPDGVDHKFRVTAEIVRHLHVREVA